MTPLLALVAVLLLVGIVAQAITLYESSQAPACPECPHCQHLALEREREQQALNDEYAQRIGLNRFDDEDHDRI